MMKRWFAGLVALLSILTWREAQGSILDCSCLSTQAVLFTNACCGSIPDLCGPATNCYSPSLFPAPGFTCTQSPAPGTPVCGSTPITFTLTENGTGISATCNVAYVVGASTNRFVLICPPNQFVPCNTTNWTFAPPAWTNTCCTNGMATNILSIVTNWPTITITWLVIDGCGLADTCSNSITFGNGQGTPCPCLAISCPTDIVVQTCLSPNPGSANGSTNINYPLPTITNSCIGTITNLVLSPPPGSPFPVGTNMVTCVVYDNLGNVDTCHFNIIVLGDTTPPVITCPPPQTNQCGSAWSPIVPTAVDNCCSNVTVSLIATITNANGTSCPDVIDFKWQATDCNGNQSICTSTVYLIDTIPPVITCRSNYVAPCGTKLAIPTVTDNCCPNPTVTMLNVITNGSVPCNYTLTITWQASDCCSNTSVCTEVVNIVDTMPPTLTCATNKIVECGNPWTFDDPTAFDACCGTNVTVTILGTFTNFVPPCTTIATRKWQAADCCGNVSTPCSQTVTVVDTTPPVATCPTNKTVVCGNAWTFDTPTAVDACCGTNVTITVSNTQTNSPNACPGTFVRTWQITDCCGNSTTCSQWVTNIDTTPPVITCGSNQTVQCGPGWAFNHPTAVDACCGTNVSINIAGLSTNVNGCLSTITVTWQATDCCGNSAFCTNLVRVIDSLPPVITCRSNYVVQCGSPIVPPIAMDNCCPNPIVTMLGLVTNAANSCNQTLTATWQAQDCCSNTATCVETFQIVDTNPPVVTCAPNKTVQCGSSWNFDPPTAFDACCGTNITITVLFTTPPFGTFCNQSTTRSWRITDCCSNSITCSQTVNIIDTTPPVITCSPNITVTPNAPWTFTPPTAVDACCGSNVSIVAIATSTNYNITNCQMIHSRIWRAKDCCHNFITCTQTVTVQYGPPPSNDFCSNAITLTLNAPYICGNNLCATPSPVGSLSPVPCGSSLNSPDVWYQVTAQCTGPMTVDTCQPCPSQPPFDTVLSVYNGSCPPGILTQVTPTSCNDNACGLRSSVTFPAVAGQAYLVRVAGAANAMGWFSLRAQQTTTPPPNDLCINAIAVNAGTPAACGTTICATPSAPGTIPTPCGNSVSTPDVWYKYTPQCGGTVTINTCGACAPCNICAAYPQYNTVLSVYTGQCPSFTQVTCNDDATTGPCSNTPQSQVTFAVSGGVTYYIRVSGAGPNAVGYFQLNLLFTPAPPPVNDLCANATPITPGVYSWNNCSANTDGPTQNGCINAYQDIWYKYTPSCSGPVTVDACSTTGFPVVWVSTGPCGSQSTVGCGGSYGPGSCGGIEQSVTFNATAGTTYYIRVGGFNPGFPLSGMLTLVGPNPPAPSCPPAGTCQWRYFKLSGAPNCVKWGWAISAPCCMNLFDTNAGPVCSGNENNLAQAFVNSINAAAAAAGCGNITATAYPSVINPGRFGICTTCNGANAFTLFVGQAGVNPAIFCAVPNPVGYAGIPVGWCSFNPDIEELRLSGQDLNNNGVDDAFDIDIGTSMDVNGDGIPDEVQGCLPPQVAEEPQAQTVQPGESILLHVSVTSNAALTYAWSRNGVPLQDGQGISGASTDTLNIDAVSSANIGDYSVTVSNTCGTVTTTPATVALVPITLPVVYDFNLEEGWIHFQVETRIGYDYIVQYKNALTDDGWTVLGTVPGAGQPELILDSEPLPDARFYRVIEEPHTR